MLDAYVGPAEAGDEVRVIVGRIRDYASNPSGLRPPRAVLIAGPAGVGKTHLARVLASELAAGTPSIAAFEVNASELTAGRVEELRSAVVALETPLVVVIDEVESLGNGRGSGLSGFGQASNDVLPALLTALDGLRTIERVHWVFLTSHPERLDEALRRPGRVDIVIELDLPAEAERTQLVELFRQGVTVCDCWSDTEAAGVVGLVTPAAIRGFLADASARIATRDDARLTMEDLSSAVERDGRRRAPAVPDEAARRRIAVHEAAHALVSTVLGDPPSRVNMNQEAGATSFEGRYRARRQAAIPDSVVRNWIASMLAGSVAEHLVFGEGSLGSESDLQRASDMARARLRNGCDPEHLLVQERGPFPESDPRELEAVRAVLEAEWHRAQIILAELKSGLLRLAGRLSERGQLAGEALAEALDDAIAPEPDALVDPLSDVAA